MGLRKAFVLITAGIVFLGLIAMKIIAAYPASTSIEASGPVFGSAPIEVVIFEDLRCAGCRTFSQTVLPQIEAEYLDTNRIQLKIIPLGVLKGSKILANAALAVYQLAPDRFLPFVQLIFARFAYGKIDNSTTQVLLNLAKEAGGIDLLKLQEAIDQQRYYPVLDRNLADARALMGKQFRIPAVYVNRVRVVGVDWQAVEQAIDEAIQ